MPTVLPVVVSLASVAALANPKSARQAKSPSVSRMLAGLTSRWAICSACAASSADAICPTTDTARAGDSGPFSSNTVRRSVPRTSRMSMNSWPSISP
ncbi:hypothetical protein C1Y40_05466 [Mycobacterium talmoniae]|uniref:Secreted protein n=1 Tax=Mycobacterium talmoniae TaxID=1858794 RepID=A0A2S8BCK1_9MYCO|nr:hypothetical protein C1Y40_05466 [Mycobacterium talmoniae]